MFDTETAAQIVRDVAANVPPKRSKIRYSAEALKFRREVEKEWRAWLARHSNARMEAPSDIGGLP